MPSITDIIRLSWETYISKFKKYLPFLLAVFALSAIAGVLNVLIIGVVKLADLWKMAIMTGAGVLNYLLTFAVSIALLIFTDKFLSNKKAIFSFEEISRVFLPALFITILVALISIGGFLLFIVPGIIFMVWYAFAMYIVVLEKKSGIGVLKESRELSRGRFWQILSRLLLPNMFWAIISYLVLAGVFNLLGFVLSKTGGVSEDSITLAIISAILSNLIGAFFAPLYLIGTMIVYRAVRK